MSSETLPAAEATRQVRRFLMDNYLFTTDEKALSDDDSLLRRGIVDSTGMMELIAFIEGSFGVAVTDAEMVPENLDSVNAIVSFVSAKSSARQEQAKSVG